MSHTGMLEGACREIDKETLLAWSHKFHRHGIVTVTDMLSATLRQDLTSEAESLLYRHAERRDLTLATTDHSPRRMSVVPSETIGAHGQLIPSIAKNETLLSMLESIAGEPMLTCPQSDELYLISRHERKGDTHGWHWGDFSFAMIWVLRAPPLEVGGLLQCVPHTSWNKESPQIHRYLIENPINTYYFASGEVYFLRSDTTLHRTIPLREDATRIMLNMTWASQKDLKRTIKGDDRWWADAEASASVSIPTPGYPAPG